METITLIAGGTIALLGAIFAFAMGIASERIERSRERDLGSGHMA